MLALYYEDMISNPAEVRFLHPRNSFPLCLNRKKFLIKDGVDH